MTTHRDVKLLKKGRNQAVRTPRERELPSEEVIMHRDGDRLIIESPPGSLLAALPSLSPLEDDFAEIDDLLPGPVEL